jgi:predicted metal-dependent hydrolase
VFKEIRIMTGMLSDKTPADLTITPRDRRFGRESVQKRWWLGGDPFATAFYNALSVTFPKGEAYFVDSVKAFRDGTPEKLAREIKAFITQEVMHSREHVAFNSRVVDAGYDISKLEKHVDDIMAFVKTRPAIINLCGTMALEHYTAIMAKQMLAGDAFAGVDPDQAVLWRWHAIEEIEHKGVAYDTWLHATRDWSRWKRWRVKSQMMTMISLVFWVQRYRGAVELLRQDGITGLKAHRGMLWFLFGKPGVLRKLFLPLASYYMPGFHPWNHDDRALIKTYDSAFIDARLPEAIAA